MQTTLNIEPLSTVLGAEIHGVDVRQMDDATFHELYQAWLHHHVIAIRDQSLTPAEQAQFCSRFGELDTYPFVQPTDEHPHVIPIIKTAQESVNFGGGWHTDTSYNEKPPKATALYAVEVPRVGGDTLFANMHSAFESLSAGMQDMLRGITGIFTPAMVHGKQGAYQALQHGMAKKDNPETAEQRVRHPIIRTHEETGLHSIYCGPAHCETFDNMTRDEALPIMKYLLKVATRPENTLRLNWRPGTLTIWDNRVVFHYALNDYPGQRRHMHRVTIKGSRPV